METIEGGPNHGYSPRLYCLRFRAGSTGFGAAIHGAGNVARAHVASWLRNPHCHIAGVGSRSRESAERLVREMGLDCPIHESFEQMPADADGTPVRLPS